MIARAFLIGLLCLGCASDDDGGVDAASDTSSDVPSDTSRDAPNDGEAPTDAPGDAVGGDTMLDAEPGDASADALDAAGDGGGGGTLYGDCDTSDDCPADQYCFHFTPGGVPTSTSACGERCDDGCSDPPEGDAVPFCVSAGTEEGPMSLCALDCGDGACPSGMECVSGALCLWP